MKLLMIVATYLAIPILICSSQHVTLIGSHLLPVESDYKVYLSAQDLTEDSILNVSLKSGAEHESFKIFENIQGDFLKEIDFELPNETQFQFYKLNIIHKNKATNSCSKQSVRINDIPNRHMIFIQLDQAVYKNNNVIKFRAFIMDHKTIPLSNTKIDVTIFDGKGYTIRKYENQTSMFGVYENYLKVAKSPNFGKWKIQVDVDGKKRSKNFQVIKHLENSLEVIIDTPKEVAFVDRKIFLNIHVKSPNDKVFTGTAKISSTARFKDSNQVLINRFVRTVNIPSDKRIVTLDIKDDLGILNPKGDMIIGLNFEVIEDKTKKIEKVTVEIPMRHKGRNNIILSKNHYFQPGFDYLMKIKVKDINGRPDGSLNPLTMKVDYENFNKETLKLTVDRKSFIMSLRNGEIDVILHPTKDTKKIKLGLEMAGTELKDEIESYPNHGVDEYLQATILNKSQKIGDSIQISVQSSEQLETLHVLVIGPYGLVYTKDYPDATGKDVYEFSLDLTDEMRPESHVIVFYVRRDDGVVIHDEFKLSLGYSAENYLEISTPQTVKPEQSVDLSFKSSKDSLVFLTAVDQNSAVLSRDNEVSRSNLYNEIIHYMNLKFSNVSVYQFDRFNAFVMQPLTAGRSCDDIEEENHENNQDDESESTVAEKVVQKYFPDVWFDEAIEVTSNDVMSIEKDLPVGFTSWRIYGTSVHPTKGFAVARKEAKISVNSEILVKIHTPATIYAEEVLKVEFSVFSSLKTPQNAKIDIALADGDLMAENVETKSNKKCKTYSHKNQTRSSIMLQLPAGSMSTTQHFFVKPQGHYHMMDITVTATAGNSKSETQKFISIQKSYKAKTVHASYLIDLKDDETFEKEVSLEMPEDAELINAEVMFSGNLLGSIQEYLGQLFNLPRGYIEQKLEFFNLILIFNDFQRKLDEEIPKEFIDELFIGYQEAVAFFDKTHNESMLTHPLMTLWIHAYAVSAVVDFKKYYEIDDHEVERALDFIGSRQNSDGSFTDDPVAYVRREMGTSSAQRYILTAQIALTFIKYQQYSNKYEEVITKALNFLNGTKENLVNDYEKVIVAYTFAVFGDHGSSKLLTSSMKNAFLKPPKHKKHMSMFVEIASHLLMCKVINNEDQKTEIEWLLSQKNFEGSFYSNFDTSLAFEALLKFSIAKNPKKNNLVFKIDDKDEKSIQGNDIEGIQITQKDHHNLKVTGQGFGLVQISYEYFTKKDQNSTENRQANFAIDIKTIKTGNDTLQIEVDVKLIAEGMKRTNLVMIEVEMPRGYQYIGHKDAKHIEMFEHKNNRTIAVFYIDIMEVNKLYKEVIQALKVFEIANPVESTVRVYDYYRTNVREELRYKFDPNSKTCFELAEEKMKEKKKEKKGSWFG